MTSALADLCAAVGHVQDTAAAEPSRSPLQSAMDQIQAMQTELGQVRQALNAGKLVPLPGETIETCTAQLGAVSKTLGSTMAQLLTAAALVCLCCHATLLSAKTLNVMNNAYITSYLGSAGTWSSEPIDPNRSRFLYPYLARRYIRTC